MKPLLLLQLTRRLLIGTMQQERVGLLEREDVFRNFTEVSSSRPISPLLYSNITLEVLRVRGQIDLFF